MRTSFPIILALALLLPGCTEPTRDQEAGSGLGYGQRLEYEGHHVEGIIGMAITIAPHAESAMGADFVAEPRLLVQFEFKDGESKASSDATYSITTLGSLGYRFCDTSDADYAQADCDAVQPGWFLDPWPGTLAMGTPLAAWLAMQEGDRVEVPSTLGQLSWSLQRDGDRVSIRPTHQVPVKIQDPSGCDPYRSNLTYSMRLGLVVACDTPWGVAWQLRAHSRAEQPLPAAALSWPARALADEPPESQIGGAVYALHAAIGTAMGDEGASALVARGAVLIEAHTVTASRDGAGCAAPGCFPTQEWRLVFGLDFERQEVVVRRTLLPLGDPLDAVIASQPGTGSSIRMLGFAVGFDDVLAKYAAWSATTPYDGKAVSIKPGIETPGGHTYEALVTPTPCSLCPELRYDLTLDAVAFVDERMLR